MDYTVFQIMQHAREMCALTVPGYTCVRTKGLFTPRTPIMHAAVILSATLNDQEFLSLIKTVQN